jgi:hypothetical protein
MLDFLNCFKCLAPLKHSFRKGFSFMLLIVLILVSVLNRVNTSNETVNLKEEKTVTRYQVAKFDFVEVQSVYAITLWILLGSLAKIGMNDFFL